MSKQLVLARKVIPKPKLFLGGSRDGFVMKSYYKKYLDGGHLVICPNLVYLGMQRTKDIDTDIILQDCLSNLSICTKAVFIIDQFTDIDSFFIACEIKYCKNYNIPYTVIEVEIKINQ